MSAGDAGKESLTTSFSELLESGKEIEGLFTKKKDMSSANGRKPARRGKSSTYKEPLVLLKENVTIYNKKHDSDFHLKITEQVSTSRYGLSVLYCTNTIGSGY